MRGVSQHHICHVCLSNHILCHRDWLCSLCATTLVMDYLFGNAAVVRNFSVYFSELLNKNSDIFQINVSFQGDDIDYLALIIVIFLTGVAIWSTKVFDEGNRSKHWTNHGLLATYIHLPCPAPNALIWTENLKILKNLKILEILNSLKILDNLCRNKSTFQ